MMQIMTECLKKMNTKVIHTLETSGSENVIKLILDDSVNDDDQYVRILVEGEDKSVVNGI